MIAPKRFYEELQQRRINFFAGVPDSLLKDFCAYLTDNVSGKKNIITANEGNAIALAAGHYLATKNIGVVYMQNSGEGNAINPLVSLADPDVYSIPMLLVVGWRGEPGKKDEPQHVKQGKITLDLLETLGIPYSILSEDGENLNIVLNKAKDYLVSNSAPYALVVKKGTFESYSLQTKKITNFELNREEAIKTVVPLLEDNAVIVSTTGKTSRELFELREELKHGHEKDFLTVGSMGHSSSIALGIALAQPERPVYCFDGDGALIMHAGSLAIVGQKRPQNFTHIIFNNFAHDSVGGQPTAADVIDIPQLALASGYIVAFSAQSKEETKSRLVEMRSMKGPTLLEIKVNKGARKKLGRPTTTPKENKKSFMTFLEK